MRKNATLAKWRAGQQTIGGWLSLANTHVAELMAHAGLDWLCVDLQHGLLDYPDLLHMLPAISTTETTPFVRVPRNDAHEITRALDAGAHGVIVPLVESRAEAAAAVAACRYPPLGVRSWGPLRAALYGGRDYAEWANAEITCIVMIETREGLANVEEIAGTPGLGAVFIGPSDLALALGLPPRGDTDEARHVEAVGRIQETCQRLRVPIGIHTTSLDYAKKRLAKGFDFVTVGSDAGHLAQGVATAVAATRAVLATRARGPVAGE
jgi:4-hydroxy-2-oxoheptanedioate aldolase